MTDDNHTMPSIADHAMSDADIQSLRDAVQWAGFFAHVSGAKASGPSFVAIASATAVLERNGPRICHSLAVRELIAKTDAEKP